MSKYKKNYLRHVIIKVDLAGIPSLDKELPKELKEIISKLFPIFEPKAGVFQEFDIATTGVKVTSRIESTDWIFYGVNKEKVLTLSRDKRITDWTSLTVDYLKYDSFEKTYGEFITMFDAVKSTFSISKIQRLGLRYVNNIYLNEKNPLNWNKYINSHLLCGLRFAEDKNLVTRIFHNLEIKYDDMNVRFQYGIRNPDYPSIIKKKEFILDYDVYWSGEQDISELSGKLKKYHDHAESLFEASIKDGLRDKMNE